jgi:hypothetical protein
MAAPNPRNATLCLHCFERSFRPAKRTFFGFQRLNCGNCGRVSLYPLTQSYVYIYWIALCLIIAFCIANLIRGVIPIPGVLFFAAVYGLWRDRQLCKAVLAKPPSEQVPEGFSEMCDRDPSP